MHSCDPGGGDGPASLVLPYLPARRKAWMRRRAFIAALGGAAAWPIVARAQQPGRMRRIGVLMGGAENDPNGQAATVAFRQGLQKKGWTDGQNIRIDYRWAAGQPDRASVYATELATLAPDVNSCEWHTGTGGIATSDPWHSNRIRRGSRSGWRRVHPGSCASWAQYYWVQHIRTRNRWQMAGTAEGD